MIQWCIMLYFQNITHTTLAMYQINNTKFKHNLFKKLIILVENQQDMG